MIRKAVNEDINEIADIWLMSMRSAHYGFKDTYWTKQYKSIRHKYSQERSDVVVYEEGGAILGFGAPDKATDPMAWVQHMNSLKVQAEETIFAELIYR